MVFDYANPTNFSEFTYPTDANGVFIVGSQMMKVEGNVVPEPLSLGLLTLLAGASLARRPRR